METKIFNEYDMIFIHIFKNLGFHSYFFIYNYLKNNLLLIFQSDPGFGNATFFLEDLGISLPSLTLNFVYFLH